MYTEMDFEEIENTLGIKFKNKEYLVQAFSHSSYVYERGLPYNEGNERLEFLGDSILGMVIAEYLFRKYPGQPEGPSTFPPSLPL